MNLKKLTASNLFAIFAVTILMSFKVSADTKKQESNYIWNAEQFYAPAN